MQLGGLALDAMLAAGIMDPARGYPTLAQALMGTPGEGVAVTDGVAPTSTLFAPGQNLEPALGGAGRRAHALRRRVARVGAPGRHGASAAGDRATAGAAAGAHGSASDSGWTSKSWRRSAPRSNGPSHRRRADIYRLAGEEFNLNSPKAIGSILFEKLGLPGGPKKKSGVRRPAPRCSRRSPLEHEIAAKLLQYREVSKLKSTYVDALPALVDPATGILHTTLHQLGAATGPPVKHGSQSAEHPGALRRSAARSAASFSPATPGNLLMAADYSQIELRLFAHMSGDEQFIAAFKRGDDIHAFTARTVFGIPESEPISARDCAAAPRRSTSASSTASAISVLRKARA